MNTIVSTWQWNGTTFLALLLLGALYAGSIKKSSRKNIGLFFSVLLLFIVCFFSPLQVLSAHYLFSAHMAVHVLLLLIAGPLLVSLFRGTKLYEHSFFLSLSKFLYKHPVVAWLAGTGIMWFWHTPAVFRAAMQAAHHQATFNWVHLVENSSLLMAGVLFCWPVISPFRPYRLPTLQSVLYLFTACTGCSLLGLLITFAPAGTYPHFLAMNDTYQLNNIILHQWQLTATIDQQAAGLIMWVPCCFVYVAYALHLLYKWLHEKESVEHFPVHHY